MSQTVGGRWGLNHRGLEGNPKNRSTKVSPTQSLEDPRDDLQVIKGPRIFAQRPFILGSAADIPKGAPFHVRFDPFFQGR